MEVILNILEYSQSLPGLPHEERSIIYIVRHGQSLGNAVRVNLPPEQSVLTDLGKKQASLLGTLLRTERFTAAYASDFPRALQTAKNILLSQSNLSPHIPIKVDEKLREKDFGIFKGLGNREIIHEYVKSGEDMIDWAPEGGETRAQVEQRMETFLQDIFFKVDNIKEKQTILVVTHSVLILHFLVYLSKTPGKFRLKNWSEEFYKVTPNIGYFRIAIEKNSLHQNEKKPRELELLTAHGCEHLNTLEVDDTLYQYTKEPELRKYRDFIQQ